MHSNEYLDLMVCPVHLSQPSAAAIADLTKIIDRKTVVSGDLTETEALPLSVLRQRPALELSSTGWRVHQSELGIAGRRVAILLAAFAGDALQISASPECLHRIRGQAARFSPLLDSGSDVLPECSAKGFLGVDE